MVLQKYSDIKEMVKKKGTPPEPCPICQDDFELDQSVTVLPCDHYYHSDCVNKWLTMHGTCPVCRKRVDGESSPSDGGDTGQTSAAAQERPPGSWI
eukprot:TRINITY_DN82752_c0_g1_i1.p1 TRINITY_DN82752_c0_g1~~TRINITY_DN82752_c0_g1_i1.p1  ORF type:complete len:111 (+),score=10.22 TRINITY_DN82752_c0_g1_i1:46-333(+)